MQILVRTLLVTQKEGANHNLANILTKQLKKEFRNAAALAYAVTNWKNASCVVKTKWCRTVEERQQNHSPFCTTDGMKVKRIDVQTQGHVQGQDGERETERKRDREID